MLERPGWPTWFTAHPVLEARGANGGPEQLNAFLRELLCYLYELPTIRPFAWTEQREILLLGA